MKITLVKALRDLKLSKSRTLLTLIGILIGIASIGAVLSAYAVLDREMQKNFMDTNPASMVFTIANLDEQAGALIQNTWPDTDVDMKTTVQARISRGDGTFGTIFLKAVQNFNNQSVDTFTLEKGNYPTGVSELALERDCLKILPNLKAGAGETVSIKLPGGEESGIAISAIVHAPGLAPASMENYSYAFVSLDMLKDLGYTGGFNELRVVSHENRMQQQAMKEMAAQAEDLLEKNGYAVSRVDVPAPGKHPHADQLSSLLFLLQAFAVIALLAACLIIINLLMFIMSRQAKQIAIQKAIGGSTAQIALPYFLYILIMSAAGILLSIPVSLLGGPAYSGFAAGILNFDITSFSVPAWVFIVQILTGILVPLLSAAWPIYRSCRVSIREGLAEKVSVPKRRKAAKKEKAKAGNTAWMMPARNLLRKKARTVLAVLALVAGGILFMTAQNMVASIDKTTDDTAKAFKWDYDIRLSGIYDESSIEQVTDSISGFTQSEIWQSSIGFFKTDTDSANYAIKIAPENTKMMDLPALYTGENTIVINQAVRDAEKWIAPGETVTLQIGDTAAEVTVGAIVTELPPMPAVYISADTYERLYGGVCGQAIYASANTKDYVAQRAITKDIEAKFAAAGIRLSENLNVYVLSKAFADHLKIIVTFLSVIAMLAVAVGGLGIGTAIGININERKHEIGVLRATGANKLRIYALTLAEVLLMGLAGFIAGAVLSYPLSVIVGNYFGNIFLHTGLNNVFSWSGAAVWLVISVLTALISGFIPARKAAKSTLREMLSNE